MTRRLLFLVASGALLASLGVASPVSAQAWTPPVGTGSVTLALQRIDQTGHRVTDGTLFKDGRSLNVSVYAEFEYALTNRLVVAAALPYVFGKYTDPAPPPPFIPFLPIDQCRCWNSGPQDLEFTARINVLNGRVGLTPSIAAVVPSQNYTYRGEAALGRDLREVRFAVDLGHRLDMISPRLLVNGGVAYAIVERALDIPNNYSTATVGASYLVHRKLSTHGVLTWQRTHGGLRVEAPPPFELLPPGEVNTPERLAQHDRLLRDNSMKEAGGASVRAACYPGYGCASLCAPHGRLDAQRSHRIPAGTALPGNDLRGRRG